MGKLIETIIDKFKAIFEQNRLIKKIKDIFKDKLKDYLRLIKAIIRHI